MKILKKVVKLIVVLLVIFQAQGCITTQKKRVGNTENSVESTSFERKFPIPNNFSPVYKDISFEDLSYMYDGSKIDRHQYRIILPRGLSNEEIKANMRHLAMQKYKQLGVKNLSIFAYRDKSEINGAYTAALYELCPYGKWEQTNVMCSDESYEENFIVSPNYSQNDKFTKGQKVTLNSETEYDRKKQEFVAATKTLVSSEPGNFSEENIRKIKNGTSGIIIDIFSKPHWVAYKIKFNNPSIKEGWVMEENLKTAE